MNDTIEVEGREITVEAPTTVEVLNRGEIDTLVATAHRFPRNVKHFRDEVLTLATLNEDTAAECSYALPRDGKTIIGPSARFAEIVASAWGNNSAGARVVDDKGTFVVAQGVFIDLQKHTRIAFEVQRRIVDKNGRRYKDDMIGVTANAACSIALRNAVLKGVPKALWADLWERARRVAVGDASTLANRRATVIGKLAHYGVTEAMVLAKLERPSVADITVDDLELLIGMGTALKEGELTVETLFASDQPAAPQTSGADALRAALDKRKGQPGATPPTYAEVAERIAKASTLDDLDVARSLLTGFSDDQRSELTGIIDHAAETLAARVAKDKRAPK